MDGGSGVGGGEAPHAGGHRLMADLLADIVEEAGHDPSVVRALPRDRHGHPIFQGLLGDLAAVLDDDLSGMLRALAGAGRVDWDAVRRSGHARPAVALDAELTSKGNLCFRLLPGPLLPSGHVADDHHWLAFPGGDRPPFGRPYNEVAFVRGAGCLFRREDVGPCVSATDAARAMRKGALTALSRITVSVWRHCLKALSAHFDVEECSVPTFIARGDAWAASDGLAIASPRGRAEYDATRAAKAKACGEAWMAEMAAGARRAADGSLATYAGDPRRLVRRWHGAGHGKRNTEALVGQLASGGIEAGVEEAWDWVGRLHSALAEVDPGWEVRADEAEAMEAAPVVEPAVVVPAAVGLVSRSPVRHPRKHARAPRAMRGDRSTPVVDAVGLYRGLRRYGATREDLAPYGVGTVDDMVEGVNAALRAGGRLPVPQDDFPSTRARFERFVRLYPPKRT